MKHFPLGTREVCSLLQIERYKLDNLIALGKVNPPLALGRRAWMQSHVLTAAKILGKDTLEVRRACCASNSAGKSNGGSHE